MFAGNLTKPEALKAIVYGHKVSREYFSSEEYIYMEKETGIILSEEGYNFRDWWENIEPTIPATTETPWRIKI